MISLQEIQNYYPENLWAFKKNLLREYLQYKILQIIFDSKYASKLCFLGGTNLRIVHGNQRFSEYLDFDSFALNESNFENIAIIVKKGLIKEGYTAEIRNVYKGAYRCYIKIPKLLFGNNLSGHEKEVVHIQLDTIPHRFEYTPDKPILNKFDVFTQIFATPIDIILSQKFYAIFNRKTMKGRDFFDVVFLLSKTKPNYEYLKQKLDINNGQELKHKLLTQLINTDMEALAKDVQNFLFNPNDAKRVTLFKEFIQETEL